MFIEILLSGLFGAIQGITEFVPISSSGHLLLFHEVATINVDSLTFDVSLHLGTLLALFIYFRKEIRLLIIAFFGLFSKNVSVDPTYRKLIVPIIIGTIPAAVVGFLFESIIESVFRSAWVVVSTLIIGGILFLLVEKIQKQRSDLQAITYRDGFWVGVAQALALIPGTSRSGITITMAMLLKIDRYTATRFSFLLSIPIVFGAGLKKLIDAVSSGLGSDEVVYLIVGVFTALLFGILAIKFLLAFTQKNSLNAFAYYRFALALIVVLILLI